MKSYRLGGMAPPWIRAWGSGLFESLALTFFAVCDNWVDHGKRFSPINWSWIASLQLNSSGISYFEFLNFVCCYNFKFYVIIVTDKMWSLISSLFCTFSKDQLVGETRDIIISKLKTSSWNWAIGTLHCRVVTRITPIDFMESQSWEIS